MKLQRLPPTPDMAGAALQPILATAQRADLAHADEMPPTEICFREEASAPNAEQLQDICQVRNTSFSQVSSLLYHICVL